MYRRDRSNGSLRIEITVMEEAFRVDDRGYVPNSAWREEDLTRTNSRVSEALRQILDMDTDKARDAGGLRGGSSVRETVGAGGIGDTHEERLARLQGKLLLRVSEAALLSISRSSSCELIHSGEIPSVKLGQSLRVVSKDLQRWIDEKKQERF